MKPKVYTSIDGNEARSPLVRVVHADEWDLLMNELRYLQGERRAVVAWLREQVSSVTLYRVDDVSVDAASAGVAMLLAHLANIIERGDHRREEER
jgi:hypothetical protein